MSAMECDRNGCYEIMCRRYSHKFGYICGECFQEMVSWCQATHGTVGAFMSTIKSSDVFPTHYTREQLEEIFNDGMY